MEFTAMPEFVERYRRLDDAAATLVDATIRRLLADPGGTWARRHRVVGNEAHAWLIVLHLQDGDCALYWDQPNPGGPLLLLLLLKR